MSVNGMLQRQHQHLFQHIWTWFQNYHHVKSIENDSSLYFISLSLCLSLTHSLHRPLSISNLLIQFVTLILMCDLIDVIAEIVTHESICTYRRKTHWTGDNPVKTKDIYPKSIKSVFSTSDVAWMRIETYIDSISHIRFMWIDMNVVG